MCYIIMMCYGVLFRLMGQVSSGIGYDGGEEDALNVEKLAEQKRLKELGLERARRAEEERLKR